VINRVNRLLAKILGKPLDLEKYDSTILCPAETQITPPPIYLKEHLQRISGVHHMSSFEYEYERISQKSVLHGPTKLYSIGEARLFRGGLWTAKREFFLRRLKQEDEIFPIELDSAVITDNEIIHQYFGHWLRDFLTSTLVGTQNMQSISFRKQHYFHSAEYLNLLEINCIYGNLGRVNSLFLLEDYSQNSYKTNRYRALRERLGTKMDTFSQKVSTGVFMARGDTGVKRHLSNEPAVIAHLEKKGFDIIYPEKMSASEIAKKLWNAPILISVEGSAFNHGLYTIAENGAYLVLQPPHIFNNVHKGICDALNRPYGFYICQPAQNSDEFYVDSMDDLDRVIDGLRNESSKRIII
jgi:capsular polysaccharide biosynthesis protein